MTDDVVDTGVELIRTFDHDELEMADLVDRLEMITEHHAHIREIIDRAVEEGLIERDNSTVFPTTTPEATAFDLENDVISKDGDFECRRCGRSLSTGYFMQLGNDNTDSEFGPFGSTCIRKVTGRE